MPRTINFVSKLQLLAKKVVSKWYDFFYPNRRFGISSRISVYLIGRRLYSLSQWWYTRLWRNFLFEFEFLLQTSWKHHWNPNHLSSNDSAVFFISSYFMRLLKVAFLIFNRTSKQKNVKSAYSLDQKVVSAPHNPITMTASFNARRALNMLKCSKITLLKICSYFTHCFLSVLNKKIYKTVRFFRT